jgi:NADPH:quinone reductase-like Zn-dependent oxidoreductase
MKAIVLTEYGTPDVLQLKEVEKPTPKDNEILIKVHATTATTADCELRSFKTKLWLWLPLRIFMGISKPRGTKILGQEVAGEVESVGKNVRSFKKGDQVFGLTGMGFGAYAEYKCLHEKSTVTTKPANATYAEAAPISTWGGTALHFIRKGNIQSGDNVLIYGAAGSIGTFAVQIAKFFGAVVTAADSTKKLDTLRAIGADHVIDYTQEDFTKNGHTYDVIFDVVGKSSYPRSLGSLKRNGRYLLANTGPLHMIRAIWTSRVSSKEVIFEFADPKVKDLVFLKELVEAGKIESVIDRVYALEQTAEAHRYIDTGDKRGHVVITLDHGDRP